jgi:ribose transport system substrate-binding protein
MHLSPTPNEENPMKKVLCWVAFSLLAVTSLSACGGSEQSTSENGSSSHTGGLPETASPKQVVQFVANRFKGKTVFHAAAASGFPLVDTWANTFKTQFAQLGIKYEYADAQSDLNKLVQIVQTAINKKPDVIIFQNLDLTATANLVQKAQAAGIYTIVISTASVAQSDAFVGGNYDPAVTALGERAAADCTKKGKKSIAILTGYPSDSLSVTADAAWKSVFKAKGIQVVSDQAANFDSGKAGEIAKTVMQQHPDLCGFIGTWDGMMVGVSSAVQNAGKAGDVLVYTTDSSKIACDAIASGEMTAALDYGVEEIAPSVVAVVQYLLESGLKAGANRTAISTRYAVIDKTNMSQHSGSCYNGGGF